MLKSDSVFNNVLLAFTCIEADDSNEYIPIAIKEIMSVIDLVKSRRSVVLVPFAHLSSKLAGPEPALNMIYDIAKKLQENDLEVNVTSFGYHKDFEIHYEGYGHPGSVAFRSIPE